MKGTKLLGVVGVSILALLLGGVAGAESPAAPKPKEIQTTKQEKAPDGEVGGSAPTVNRPGEMRTRSDAATSHTQEFAQRIQEQGNDLEAQPEAVGASQAQLKQHSKAAYKGGNLDGFTLALGSLFGGGAKTNAVLANPTVRILTKGRESVRSHRDSRRALEGTPRQLDRKNEEHGESRKEEPTRTEKPRREPKLEVSIGGSDPKREQMEARITELRAAEDSGLFERPPASGGAVEFKEQELEVAHEDIVALPVEPIPYERYVQIYKASAKRYGFARDWYVLAAVGRVESNHGENIGPSSAGAMGPMQFLPSTWREYGVDGNKDGVKNILDPEDAIPAAAAYLEAGGAPDDWYAALYTYNHAGWYVRKVLGIAEGYRRLAKDDEIEPYV